MTQNQFLPEQVLIPFFGKESEVVGVEIGTLGGSGTVAMLNRMPNLKLYTIDPWIHIDGKNFEAEQPQEYHDINYRETLKRLVEFGDRVVVIKKKSDESLEDTPEKVDFVHIDGSHDEIDVKNDIENWLPKIKKGGILSGHDIQIDWIARIVKEKFGDKVKYGDDFLWWVVIE
jgi:predicted O-methyltransferase YrrM